MSTNNGGMTLGGAVTTARSGLRSHVTSSAETTPGERAPAAIPEPRPGQNAPLRRRITEKLLTSWQPLLGPLTQRRDTVAHRAAAWLTPRVARMLIPLAERAEARLMPREYRGWNRVRPQEVLSRPTFQELQELDDVQLEVVAGQIPEGLQGYVFWQSFSHEVMHELRFMGRSMLFRLDASRPGELRLTSRKLVTPSQIFKEEAEGTPDAYRFLRALLWISPTAGYMGDYGQGVLTVDDGLVVAANTVSPMIVDKKTLKVKGPFGSRDDYYPTAPMAVPFPPRYSTAHAFYDEISKHYFSLNYGYGFTRVVMWSPGWKRFRSYLLRDEKGRAVNLPQSSHQVMVTRDYVIILNNDGHLLDFPNPFCQDTVAFIIERKYLTEGAKEVHCKRVELPRTATHQIANYDTPDGVITIHTTGTNAFSPDMSGILPNDMTVQSGEYYSDNNWGTFPLSQSDMAHIARYKIDAKEGRLLDAKFVSDPRYTWNAQYNITSTGMGCRMYEDAPRELETMYATFFGFKKSSVMRRMTEIFAQTKYTRFRWDDLPETPVPGAMVAIDCKSWEIKDAYSFEENDQPGHACNVPTEDGGFYLIMPVQNNTGPDQFYIFHPERLSEGPVCILSCPVRLPYLQHTTWTDSLETRSFSYPVDMARDLLVQGMVPSVEKIIREKVLPAWERIKG